MAEEKITIDLNVFDDEGVVVDGTTADLTEKQISDIIDHASQLILLHRKGTDLSAVIDELDEALTTSGVIDEISGPGLKS